MLAAPGAHPLGGGTDLLVCVEEGIAHPDVVVDLRGIGGSADIDVSGNRVRIGASATLHQVSTNAGVLARFPALAEACAAVGSPALRRMGTIGGNLCQRPRCWYFRRGFPCHKNGGADCPAREGENRYLAILDGGPCFIVHPSDPAVALTALGADVEISGPDGTRSVPIPEFYVLPADRMDRETVLRDGEVVTGVVLPGAAPQRQFFRKLMQRGAWDFALVSVAAARGADGVRIVLGGVAPRPWPVPASVLEDVASGGLDDESIAALAARALYDARPLSGNEYKVALAESLLRDAMRAVAL